MKRKKSNKMDVDLADSIADDLPDGAYWAMMEELTGLDSCEIAQEMDTGEDIDEEGYPL